MNDRLAAIFAAVVPGEPEVVGRVVDASDPARVGETITGPGAYRLFLVNEGELDITGVAVYAGGFASDDDDVVELERSNHFFPALGRHSVLLLQELDVGLLDFVLWYELKLTFADGVQLRARFDIPKAYALRDSNLRSFAALDGQAHEFALEPSQT